MGLGNFDICLRCVFYAIYIIKNDRKNRQLESRNRAFRGDNMISNQILQSTIDGLKSITRKELSVVEKEGKVIATTEESMIGRQIDAVENFISSPAESQLVLG